jgi:hypothetical protein
MGGINEYGSNNIICGIPLVWEYLKMFKREVFGCEGYGNENLINFVEMIIFYGLMLFI